MKANVNPKNGGPYWTPITPIKGSLFHADSQPSRVNALTYEIYLELPSNC
jgi:hypothetical protein